MVILWPKAVGDLSEPLTESKTRLRWIRVLPPLLAVVLIAGTYANRQKALRLVAYCLNVSETPARSDYVMVLGGGASTRPFAAAALFRARLADAVLIPRSLRVPGASDGYLPTESDLIARILKGNRVPSESLVYLERECSNTRDEAVALRKFLQEKSMATVMVITSHYHTRRARWIFQRELGPLGYQVSVLGVPSETFNEENWWKSKTGFISYMNEYLKLAHYWMCY